MAKKRIPISQELGAEVMFASDRTCCVCRMTGRRVQIHHIDENPANNAFENLSVLCFDCHDQTQVRGGFGRRLDAQQVRLYRRDWLEAVRVRRAEAAALIQQAAERAPDHSLSEVREFAPPLLPSRVGIEEYIRTLPALRRLAQAAALPGWNGDGGTAGMMQASHRYIDVLEGMLVTLAGFYPVDHFDHENPRDYFSELIASRFRWHRYHFQPDGEGFSGTIVGPLAADAVMSDVEQMVVDLVRALSPDSWCVDSSSFSRWLEDWGRDEE